MAECPSYIPWAKELSTNSSFGGCWGHHQSELIISKVANKIDLHNNLKSRKFSELNLDIMRKKIEIVSIQKFENTTFHVKKNVEEL